MRAVAVSIIVFLLFSTNIFAQAQRTEVSVGFYNVENLFDTIPSMSYDDADFTPPGRNKWTGERYRNKISNIAKVIDDMNLDVLGLAEVENEEVLRDLVRELSTDYNFIHSGTNDRRGMGLALLYKGDKFVPEEVRTVNSNTSRDFLYVKGGLKGQRVDIMVCHMPSKANKKSYREKAFGRMAFFADSLTTTDKNARLIIAGDFNAEPTDKIFRKYFLDKKAFGDGRRLLFSPFLKSASLGQGTYRYNGKWSFIDNVLLSTSLYYGDLRYCDSGIVVKSYMVNRHYGKPNTPHRTFESGRYTEGFSDHFPVYVILEIK